MSSPQQSERSRPTQLRSANAPAWLIVVAIIAVGTTAIPLGYLVVRAIDAGLPTLARTLFRPRVWELTFNSLALALAVTGASLVLGVACAWLLTRVRVPGVRAWLLICTLPLAVPSYLAGYGWLVWVPGFNGFWASWLVMTAVCTPYVMLPVAAALRGASGDLEQVARTLGRGPIGAFRAATWPHIRGAAAAGALLVALYTLSDFGLVSMLRFQTLTWGINAAYGASFDRNQAALLSLILVALALIVVSGERRARGRSAPARIAGAPVLTRPGTAAFPIAVLLLLSPLVGVAIPVAGLTSRLVEASTLRELDLPRLAEAIGTTLALAVGGAAAAVILALPVAWVAARYRGRLVAAIEAAGFLGHALPGIVVGLSLVFFALAATPALYQSALVLVFAYSVLFAPKAIGTMRAGFAAVPDTLVEVARTLGVSRAGTWWRVTAPLALPGIGVAALLVGISVMKELPATLLLRPTGISTLATELWSRTVVFEFGAAAPYAAALVLVAAVPAVLLSGVRGSAKGEL